MSAPLADRAVPWWAWAVAAAWAVSVVMFAAFAWSRFSEDLVPIDNSRVGPNLTAWYFQGPVTAIVAMVVWPVTRRAIHRFVDHKVVAVKDHIDGHMLSLHARHDSHEAEVAKIHEKLERLLGGR